MAEGGSEISRPMFLQLRQTEDRENTSEENPLVIEETSEERALDLSIAPRHSRASTDEVTGEKERKRKKFSRLDTLTQVFETEEVKATVPIATLPGMRLNGKRMRTQRVELKRKRSGICTREHETFMTACKAVPINVTEEIKDIRENHEKSLKIRMKNSEDRGRRYLLKVAEIEVVGESYEEKDLD